MRLHSEFAPTNTVRAEMHVALAFKKTKQQNRPFRRPQKYIQAN